MTSRRRMAAVLVALCSVVAFAGPADAATVLGQTSVPQATSCDGSPELEYVPAGAAYSVQSPGVITSWSFQSGTQATVLALRIFRPVSGDVFRVVGDAGLQNVPAGTGLHTFSVRIAVTTGDVVGLRGVSGACAVDGAGTDKLHFHLGAAAPVGSTATYTPSDSILPDIAASLEPDVDGDGYGDETQDLCPESAVAALTPCPAPDTTITRHPRHPVARVKVTFTSSVPGSTFRCSLDGRRFKRCASPLVYACPPPGRHHLRVRATAPYGLVEVRPAKVTFHVVERHARGC